MNPIIEKFLERPTSHKVGFWLGSLLVFGGIYWQYFYGPVTTQLTELEEKRNSLNAQVISQKRIARNLPKFLEEVRVLESRFNLALQELPDKKDIPNLLRSVADLAKQAGLEVSLFRPEPDIKRDFFVEVPVTLTVEGTYHQIASFFDEVSRLTRIVNIKAITMREPKGSDRGMLVKADCTATTFRYLTEEERQEAAESGKEKKRRR